MLFSSSEVAEYINTTFEPAWESVRPAPMITIDFGNGHVVKRTLQGNIATYVCGPDGSVYDILPGIYAPDVYRVKLEELKKLADSLRPYIRKREPATPIFRMCMSWSLSARLREHHQRREMELAAPPVVRLPTPQMQSVALTGGGFKGFGGGGGGSFGGGSFGGFIAQPQPVTPQMVAIARTGGGFKGGALLPGGFGGAIGNGGFIGNVATSFGGFQSPSFSGIEGPLARVIAGASPPPTLPTIPAGALALRPELKLDSEVNERIRRKAIHAHLATQGIVQPGDIKKWLFREVLHADLDDPKLGLGPLLDSNYPFLEEDKTTAGK